MIRSDDERAAELVRTFIRGKNPLDTHGEMAGAISEALSAVRREEAERCAKIADDYAEHMETVAADRDRLDKPSVVSSSKGDAGRFIASAIRSPSPKEEDAA